MDNKNYVLDVSALKTLCMARSIAEVMGWNFIPKEFFFVSLFLLPDEPMYKTCLSKGITQEQLYEKVLNYLSSHLDPSKKYCVVPFELEDYTFYFEEGIFDILYDAQKHALEYYQKEYIGATDLFTGFSEVFPDTFREITKDFMPIKVDDLTSKSKKLNEKKDLFTLPSNLSSFLSVLNDKYSPDEKECKICGRERETEQLMRILMKKTKRNAVLIGDPGVGKTALVEKFTWMIVTGNCPKRFKNSIMLSLDVNAIVAGTQYRGSAEERFMSLISFLEYHPECILFIDEIHLLLGAGACKDGDLDLANALKPLLARGSTQVIGATTINEYTKYFSKDSALKRRFEKIVVNEPKTCEVYPMIKNQVKALEKAHHTTISKEVIGFAILNASCFNFETKNPDRTLDLLDKAMVCAELEERSTVTKEDIFSNFSINRKKFEKMSPIQKTATAYHEAGHYLVYRFAEELLEYNVLAVSIMPAEDYLGVNVIEIDPDITPTCNLNYYIQLLGSKLAGRVAEKIYSNTLSSGASSDLTKATRIAKDVITRYGLDEEFTQDRVFLRESDNPMYNDELISKINVRLDKLLEKARNFVETLLEEKRGYLDTLANALIEKGMLSSIEIDQLFEEYEKNL